VKEMRLELTRH